MEARLKTHPAATAQPRLKLRLLGTFEAVLDGKTLTGFDSDKSRALLAYLAVESHRAHRREVLCNLLWPNVAEASARQSLSQALSNLRKLLGDPTRDSASASISSPSTGGDTTRFILASRETVQFNPRSDFGLDVATLQSAAERGDLAQLLALPSSVFLEGFTLADAETFEEWQLLYRESLQHILIEALTRLAHENMGADQREWAIRAAQRQLDLDPWREEAHRQLMLAYALSGQRSTALAQYEKCKTVLRQVLNVEPGAETQALFNRIRSDAFEAPAAPTTPRPAQPQSAVSSPATSPATSSATRIAPTTPASRSATRAPTPLPTALTPFIGRAQELAALAELIAQPQLRLITLTGIGGMGKSRLAIEVATRAHDEFPDGTAFVPLAALNSADLIVPAIAGALNIALSGSGDPISQLAHALRNRRSLVVLDGLEHLLPTGAEVLAQLLSALPQITWLVTSREVLQLSGEWVYEVQGMGDAAERLFVQTARRARNDLQLDTAEHEAVTRICQQLGGTPLAIELAAAWVRMLSLDEIADEIGRDLDLLAAHARDVPDRHRSMRAVFDHSWDLLSEADQNTLERLAVFRGGFTRESARQVAGASLAALSAFIGKSFIRRTRESRFDLHELVRQYALQRFEARSPGELQRARLAHANHFLQLARTAEDALNSAAQVMWLNQLEAEHDNLRAALNWTCEQVEANSPAALLTPLVIAAQLVDALGQFWFIRGHHREGRRWLIRVTGLIERNLPQVTQPPAPATETAAAAELGDAALIRQAYASALRGLGFLTFLQGDLRTARTHLEAAIRLSPNATHKRTLASALHFLGLVASSESKWDEAQHLQEQSAILGDELGVPLIHALAVTELGHCAMALQDWTTAEARYREGAALFRQINDANQLASPLRMLGYLALRRGQAAEARVYFTESLRLNLTVGDPRGQAACLMGLASAAFAEGNAELGARQFGTAQALLKAVADSLMPGDQQALEPHIAALQTQRSQPTIAAAYAAGQAMPMEAAIQQALASVDA